MTAVAWAIMFIGLIFYDAIYNDKLVASGRHKDISSFIMLCLFMLTICTVREFFR